MVAYTEPSFTLLFVFVLFFSVVGHLTFFHIYSNYVSLGQKVQVFLYARQGVFYPCRKKIFHGTQE